MKNDHVNNNCGLSINSRAMNQNNSKGPEASKVKSEKVVQKKKKKSAAPILK